MAHIELTDGIPGIAGLWAAYPLTGKPIAAFVQQLMRGPSPLSEAEREHVAAEVSRANGCTFCALTHAAVTQQLCGGTPDLDERMHALLAIAEKVRIDGRSVGADDIDRAKAAGASEHEIHDTVLIAASFCMFNRYVDGLGAWTPDDPAMYQMIGELLVAQGYDR